jgi:palmitoyltransferase
MKYWAVLYVVCRPEIAIDEADSWGYTPLHWAVANRDEASTHIFLKLGANPNVVGHDGCTPLHLAASTGNRKCIQGLLEAGADVRAKDENLRTAEEMASEFGKRDIWDRVIEELGINTDGSRVCKPLSEVYRNLLGFLWPAAVRRKLTFLQPSVNIIVFSVPTISLCIAFLIAGVFPWYMSITLSPAAFYALSQVCKPPPLPFF